MTRDTRKAVEVELAKLDKRLAAEFRKAIQAVKSRAQRKALEKAIASGNLDDALNILRMNSTIWGGMHQAISDSFITGAMYQVEVFPKRIPKGGKLLLGYSGRHERAERWIRTASGNLIEGLIEEQRDVVRSVILEGVQEGRGARAIARNLIGANKARTGGVLGLDKSKTAAVQRAREELSDPTRMSNYLTRKRRDSHLDYLVHKALGKKRALSEEDIERLTDRYSARLLQLRAETIARTEALSAFNAGRFEAVQQNIDSGELPEEVVTMEWRATPGSRTRDTHADMNGQRVKPGEAFVSPSGARMLHPGDTSLGASGDEIIQCRCTVRTLIDFSAMAT